MTSSEPEAVHAPTAFHGLNGRVTREQKEQSNGHRGGVVWLTGLSGAGKSTLSAAVERELFARGVQCCILDGDVIRHGLNRDLGFSAKDRTENIRRTGEAAKLLTEAGLLVIAALLSPRQADRSMVRGMFAEGDFIEVYVRCPLEECERRDPKGLYRRARSGELAEFTGISAPYEAPSMPELVVDTDKLSIQEATALIIGALSQHFIRHGD